MKKLLINLYNRYMEEVEEFDEEEEYEAEQAELEIKERAAQAVAANRRQALMAKGIDEDSFSIYETVRARLQEQLNPQVTSKSDSSSMTQVDELASLSKVSFYDYTREEKVCCHCESSLDDAVRSATDQWGMSYVICPSCRFVGRIDTTGACVKPSDDFEEMEHALNLFAQNGYNFRGFNAR